MADVSKVVVEWMGLGCPRACGHVSGVVREGGPCRWLRLRRVRVLQHSWLRFARPVQHLGRS